MIENNRLPIFFTYPIIDIILYGSFHPSCKKSKICVNLCSLELKVPYIFFSRGLIKLQQPPHI